MASTVGYTVPVSRSVHTIPIELRAARRVRAPFASRGAADVRRADRLRRSLREAGVAVLDAGRPERQEAVVRLPRIRVSRASPGLVHAVTPPEIRRTMLVLGESSFYGLRAIDLLPRAAARPSALHLGRYIAPATVQLFAVEPPPWRLTGVLDTPALERMQLYGAQTDDDEGVPGAVIRWPGTSLRDFMLIDVLMHEVGHHVVQQYAGKRSARVRRTRDHEAFAASFAERCRVRYLQARPFG